MSQLTRCPNCATTFRVSDAQLALRGGRVRCGNCSFVFNALACQVDADPVTIVDIAYDAVQQEHDPFWDAPMAGASAAAEEAGVIASIEESAALPEISAWPKVNVLDEEERGHAVENEQWIEGFQELPPPAWLKTPSVLDDDGGVEVESETAHSEVFVQPARLDPAFADSQPQVSQDWLQAVGPSPWRWVWRLANLAAFVLALTLTAVLLRQPLSEWYPPSRPLLAAACQKLACELHASQNQSLLFLDGIEFSFDPADTQRLELNAVLRNTASYPQAWPIIDVQLMDKTGKRAARRLLRPTQYLPPQEIGSREFAAQQEVQLNVVLQLTGIAVENYTVGFYRGQ